MREKFEQIMPPEEKEKYGHNVEISVIFARHADYDKLTKKLSEKGREQAMAFGKNLVFLEGIKGYSSEAERTKETLEIIKETIEAPKKYTSRTRPEFAVDISAEEVEDYFGGLNEYLENKKIKTLPREVPLAKEIAGFLAKRLDLYIRMSKRLREDSRVTLLNICHMPHLVSFLKEAIGKEIDANPIDLKGKNFAEKLGGKFNPTEDFRIKIVSDTKDLVDTKINLSFRQREFVLKPEDILTIASYTEGYEKRQKEKVD